MNLDLSMFDEELFGWKSERIREGMVKGVEKCDPFLIVTAGLVFIDSIPVEIFDFIDMNCKELAKRKIYEECLVMAYPMKEGAIDTDLILHLFGNCSKRKLKKLSEKPPHGFPLRVYRGIQDGDPFGISWTASLEKAKWFADRGPDRELAEIYSAVIEKDDFFLYTNGRNEDEFIVDTYMIDIEKVAV